ncbi:MAG TPA: ABC transporter substrate-binding protein [Stellaceae bacterium]|nr:ABC transporter substrate-binding protein [Stellaceae bacterium]
MRRRDFLWLLGCGVAASHPWYVCAQTSKVHRIAMVSGGVPIAQMSETGAENYRVLFGELRRLGYVEGQNLMVERYFGGGRSKEYGKLVSDVLRGSPELVLVTASNLMLEFKAQTTTIPLVGDVGDPIALGITSSLAHPGGNITGVASDAGLEVWSKRLSLLKAAIPTLSRVGLLVTPTPFGQRGAAVLKEACDKEGIILIGSPLDTPIDETAYRRAFATLAQEKVEAVYVGEEGEHTPHLRLIIELAQKHGLPAIYAYRWVVQAGGLMAYAADLPDRFLHVAKQIDQILKGTKPGDIPFYQAQKFRFVINLKTAKALGIEISPNLLAQADEVIE